MRQFVVFCGCVCHKGLQCGGGANGYVPLLGGGENCVFSEENTFLSAKSREGHQCQSC